MISSTTHPRGLPGATGSPSSLSSHTGLLSVPHTRQIAGSLLSSQSGTFSPTPIPTFFAWPPFTQVRELRDSCRQLAPCTTVLFYWPQVSIIVTGCCLFVMCLSYTCQEHRPVSMFAAVVHSPRACPACGRPTVPVGSGFCWTAQPHCVSGGFGTPALLGTGLFFQRSPSEEHVGEAGGAPYGSPGPTWG